MSYRQMSYYTDKPILSKKDICMSYVVKKPMSGQPYLWSHIYVKASNKYIKS